MPINSVLSNLDKWSVWFAYHIKQELNPFEAFVIKARIETAANKKALAAAAAAAAAAAPNKPIGAAGAAAPKSTAKK